ncbi:MAG: hypothetical protein LBV32_09525 [Tannerellaceae bacterium]|jgi:hypothetical protein|nr:hypothetical protein [Tannerellaceae bacterium]
MKTNILKVAAIMIMLAGEFACTNNEDTDENNMVSIKIQCNSTNVVDPNIASFALPGIVDAVCTEHLPYPNYGGIPEAWSPHLWTIYLVLSKGTDRTKLAPIITLAPNVKITPVSGMVCDFTNPVEWILIAPDGSTVNYQATVFVIGDPYRHIEYDNDGNQIITVIYPDDPHYPY